jgi:hypothetical protein
VLLRIDRDPASGFSIGENVLYALVPEVDLASGRFERLTAMVANV